MTRAAKVLVVADLHLDHWLAEGRDPFAALVPDRLASLDALIVAGDLTDKPKVRWSPMLAHLSRYVEPSRIHVVPGNHDYYHHVLDGDDRLAEICAAAGVGFAQKQELVIGGRRYLCCTLWTDFALSGDVEFAMRAASKAMNDYRYIRLEAGGYCRISPMDVARVHADHRNWLEARLAAPFAGETIVVTHHAPLSACLSEASPVPDAYASDLSGLIATYQPDQWLFGHTHHPVEFRQGRTLLRNVSLGYPGEVEEGGERMML